MSGIGGVESRQVSFFFSSWNRGERLLNHNSEWHRLKRAVAVYRKYFTYLLVLSSVTPSKHVADIAAAESAILLQIIQIIQISCILIQQNVPCILSSIKLNGCCITCSEF